jgi:predicted nucleotidyltransferase component of viral defense system
LNAYNVETVLAEKVEAILSRGVFTTRPRDYYDVYMILKSVAVDKVLFKKALTATVKHRGSSKVIGQAAQLIETFARSDLLRKQWEKFRREFDFAQSIEFEAVCAVLCDLVTK